MMLGTGVRYDPYPYNRTTSHLDKCALRME
jgi:hypothetical protein